MNERVKAMLARFGADDCREGSRSVGHDGIDRDEWEEYAEVPLTALEKICDALEGKTMTTTAAAPAVTFRKVKDAQPMGEYKPTSVDEAKKAADFRLIAVGTKNDIVWKDGRRESVTRRQLAKLQAAHTWATDF